MGSPGAMEGTQIVDQTEVAVGEWNLGLGRHVRLAGSTRTALSALPGQLIEQRSCRCRTRAQQQQRRPRVRRATADHAAGLALGVAQEATDAGAAQDIAAQHQQRLVGMLDARPHRAGGLGAAAEHKAELGTPALAPAQQLFELVGVLGQHEQNIEHTSADQFFDAVEDQFLTRHRQRSDGVLLVQRRKGGGTSIGKHDCTHGSVAPSDRGVGNERPRQPGASVGAASSARPCISRPRYRTAVRHRLQQEFDIGPERLRLDVLNVQLDLLVEGNLRTTRDLPNAGDARDDLEPPAVR